MVVPSAGNSCCAVALAQQKERGWRLPQQRKMKCCGLPQHCISAAQHGFAAGEKNVAGVSLAGGENFFFYRQLGINLVAVSSEAILQKAALLFDLKNRR